MTFVRDYLQLQFNPPPMLNAYTPVTVRCGELSATFGEADFASLIVAQIGKVVREVALRPKEELEIRFQDGSAVAVSLRPDHYRGPEAIYLSLQDGSFIVI